MTSDMDLVSLPPPPSIIKQKMSSHDLTSPWHEVIRTLIHALLISSLHLFSSEFFTFLMSLKKCWKDQLTSGLFSCRVTIRIFYKPEETYRGYLLSKRRQKNYSDESQLRMSLQLGFPEQANERMEGQISSPVDYPLRSVGNLISGQS